MVVVVDVEMCYCPTVAFKHLFVAAEVFCCCLFVLLSLGSCVLSLSKKLLGFLLCLREGQSALRQGNTSILQTVWVWRDIHVFVYFALPLSIQQLIGTWRDTWSTVRRWKKLATQPHNAAARDVTSPIVKINLGTYQNIECILICTLVNLTPLNLHIPQAQKPKYDSDLVILIQCHTDTVSY